MPSLTELLVHFVCCSRLLYTVIIQLGDEGCVSTAVDSMTDLTILFFYQYVINLEKNNEETVFSAVLLVLPFLWLGRCW